MKNKFNGVLNFGFTHQASTPQKKKPIKHLVWFGLFYVSLTGRGFSVACLTCVPPCTKPRAIYTRVSALLLLLLVSALLLLVPLGRAL